MGRKDCGQLDSMILFAVLCCGAVVQAGETVKVWPTATVTTQHVTLADVCALGGFNSNTANILSDVVVAPAPKAGGSTVIELSQVQKALRQGGANLATVLIVGATECAVSRPADAVVARQVKHAVVRSGKTLREAVEAAFVRATARLGDRVNLQFGRTDVSVLNLSEPQFTFDVRIRGGRVLGQLIKVDVDVLADGRVVQRVPLVVSSTLMRDVVVAVNPINAKGPIRERDVRIEERSFDHLSELSDVSLNEVIGLRAKRYIPEGRMIDPDDLEMVPLVVRGELVDVISRSGGVVVRSVAKADETGSMGELVALRTSDRRGPKLSGYVIGKRLVSMTPPDDRSGATLAMGGGR